MKLNLFFYLCFLYGCDNCQPSSKLINNLDKIEIINRALQQDNKQLQWINSTKDLAIKFPHLKTHLLQLELSLNFIEIERQYLNKDSTRLGLAYMFTKDVNGCTQFLLFTTNPSDRERFINLEQFVDYIKETKYINPYWTYRKVDVKAYE